MSVCPPRSTCRSVCMAPSISGCHACGRRIFQNIVWRRLFAEPRVRDRCAAPRRACALLNLARLGRGAARARRAQTVRPRRRACFARSNTLAIARAFRSVSHAEEHSAPFVRFIEPRTLTRCARRALKRCRFIVARDARSYGKISFASGRNRMRARSRWKQRTKVDLNAAHS